MKPLASTAAIHSSRSVVLLLVLVVVVERKSCENLALRRCDYKNYSNETRSNSTRTVGGTKIINCRDFLKAHSSLLEAGAFHSTSLLLAENFFGEKGLSKQRYKKM